MQRYQSRKVRPRDFRRGGRYHNVQDWYCEGCGKTHSGYRDSTTLPDGKMYCDQGLYRRQQQLSVSQQG